MHTNGGKNQFIRPPLQLLASTAIHPLREEAVEFIGVLLSKRRDAIIGDGFFNGEGPVILEENPRESSEGFIGAGRRLIYGFNLLDWGRWFFEGSLLAILSQNTISLGE